MISFKTIKQRIRSQKAWFFYTVSTMLLWGAWGALTELPEKNGFPTILSYSVWAISMIPCALIALKFADWKLEYDRRSWMLGSLVGILGSGSTLILFYTLRIGPAYLIFPIIALSPVVTVILSVLFLRERASRMSWIGIIFALIAVPLLSWQSGENGGNSEYFWLILTLFVFLMWGLQAFFMKFANRTMNSESIFFYMMLTGLLFIPVSIYMTDFSKPINWGLSGPYLSFIIQILNAIGALLLVYAFRYGRAVIVSPLINAGAPLITVALSLILYRVIPNIVVVAGMVCAIFGAFLLATETD
ncbi:DMT family transporter [Flavobacteriaceae bacterium F89]|uniref:DMT family transporter n=1 Tax=Cerina litoralis TaxID=2874477 RepID=A0AAE3JRR5_9FLAO|nr:EamA family transporter [Cerina litoralis]MCG2461653.1 DMT family transporter [Cerina litoralis]